MLKSFGVCGGGEDWGAGSEIDGGDLSCLNQFSFGFELKRRQLARLTDFLPCVDHCHHRHLTSCRRLLCRRASRHTFAVAAVGTWRGDS